MHAHGDNLQQKESAEVKYADAESRRFLREIRQQYEVWRTANQELKGPGRNATPQDTETPPHARIERKDHDFAIGVSVSARLNCAGQEKEEVHDFHIPAVAVECKTYLDKTMLEGSSTAAEQLKFRNPNALYIVVSEWLKLTGNVNLRKFKVDQIYVLRKQRNTDREYRFRPDYERNPIYLDVVEHLFHTVRTHLTTNWEGGVAYGLERGHLL